jgi:hypothetical protein
MNAATESPTQPDLATALLANAKSAILAAVEIHNKPIFPYRYEVSTLLAINAWELVLKAFIARQLPSVKLIRQDDTAKSFPECLSCVSSALGKAFEAPRCNLETLYDYRNNVAHFYYEDLGVVVLGLLKSAVLFFVEFLEEHFDERLDEETNLVLLPIGFQKPMSPIDFVSNRSASKDCSPEVKEFLQAIRRRSEHLLGQGIEDSIMINYSLALINESRVKNADLVAAINNASLQPNVIAVHNIVSSGILVQDPSARPIRIVEATLYEPYLPRPTAMLSEMRERNSATSVRMRGSTKLCMRSRKIPTSKRQDCLIPTIPTARPRIFTTSEYMTNWRNTIQLQNRHRRPPKRIHPS